MNASISFPDMRFSHTKQCRTIGIEYEFPVVTESGERGVGKDVFRRLIHKGWVAQHDPFYADEVIGVEKNGVALTTEAGLGILELVLPPARNLHDAAHAFHGALSPVVATLHACGMIPLGYGIQPLSGPEPCWSRKRRYERLREAVAKFCHGTVDINNMTVAASAQVHISIARDEVVDATNVMNALAGIFILLFANAPVWRGACDEEGGPAVRERFWGFAPERTGIPPKFGSLDELFTWFGAQEVLLLPVEGSNDYLVPERRITWNELPESARTQEAWRLHEGTIWPNARPRTQYGTIEIRPVCSQGRIGMMTLAALALGIAENLPEAAAFVDKRCWDEWRDIRDCALAGTPINNEIELVDEVYAIAEHGLRRRPSDGFLGSKLLAAWRRMPRPATRALAAFKQGGIPALISAVRL